MVFCCTALSLAENENDRTGLSEKEWTWEDNSVATFQGSVSLENLPAGKLLLKLSFKTDPQSTNPGDVVFQSVNGKKLTLRKQKPDYLIEHGEENTMEFVGGWRTPEDVYFTGISILLQICSEDGSTILKEEKLNVSRSQAEVNEKDDGKFRLKTDFSMWIRWTAVAAGIIWICASLRVIINKTRNKKRR